MSMCIDYYDVCPDCGGSWNRGRDESKVAHCCTCGKYRDNDVAPITFEEYVRLNALDVTETHPWTLLGEPGYGLHVGLIPFTNDDDQSRRLGKMLG